MGNFFSANQPDHRAKPTVRPDSGIGLAQFSARHGDSGGRSRPARMAIMTLNFRIPGVIRIQRH